MKTLALAKHLAASLRDHPEEWKFDAYNAEHRSGAEVWLSNGYPGLGIKERRGMAEIGGVTTASAFFGHLIPWRRVIGRAFFAEQRRRLKPDSSADRIVAALSKATAPGTDAVREVGRTSDPAAPADASGRGS